MAEVPARGPEGHGEVPADGAPGEGAEVEGLETDEVGLGAEGGVARLVAFVLEAEGAAFAWYTRVVVWMNLLAVEETWLDRGS